MSGHFTAIHATHVTEADTATLGAASAFCCLCPTTERDLADGVGPAARLRDDGALLALGSDSHAIIEPLEEARAVELDERLVSGERGRHAADDLLYAATAGGYASVGWPEGGMIRAGALADLVAFDLTGVRLAGTPDDRLVDGLVFAGAAADVRDVVVGGRFVVRDGQHVTIDVPRELECGHPGCDRMTTVVLDDIGMLVTNDPALGEGPLGIVRDAAVVIENGRVAEITSAGVAADERIAADGRCVIPGFVDSHTHLVFAGDRAEEFAARMAGAPYAAGGIRATVSQHARGERRAAAGARRGPPARVAAGRDHASGDQVRLRARRRW